MDPKEQRRDIIKRSVTLQVVQDFHKLRDQLARYGLINETLSNRAATDPMMDPLYRMLVDQARQKLQSQQQSYKHELELLLAVRSRIERFLSLLTRNTALRKRIDDARAEFLVSTNVLSELRLSIKVVQDKQELVKGANAQLQTAKSDIKQEIQKQRDQYQQLLDDLASVNKQLSDLKQLESDAQTQLTAVMNDLSKSEGENAQHQQELDDMSQQLQQLLQQLADKTKQRDQLREDITETSDNVTALNNEINDRRSSISKNKNMNSMMTDQIKKQKALIDQTNADIGAKQSDITDAQNTLTALQIDRDVQLKELADLDAEDKLLSAELDSLNKKLQDLMNQVSQGGSAGASLATKLANVLKTKLEAEQTRDLLAKDLKDKRDSINALRAQATDLNSKIADAKQTIKDLDSQTIAAQDQASNAQIQKQTLEDEIKTLTDELQINKQLEADILAEGGAAQSTLDKLIQDQNARQKTLIDLTDKLLKAEAELAKAKDTSAQLNLLKKITDAMKERDRLNTNQQQLQSDIDAVTAQLATLNITPQQLIDAQNDPVSLANQLADLKKQIQALDDKNKELQKLRDALANPNADAIISLKDELTKLEQKGAAMVLTQQEQTRKQQLEALLGGPVTQEGIDKYKALLEKTIADNQSQSGQVSDIQAKLAQLDALLKLKDSAELSDLQLDALKQKLRTLGVSESDMQDSNLAATVQKYKDLIDKTQADIDAVTAAKTKMQLQVPLLQQLTTDAESLKKAEADKTQLKSDYKDIVKRISDIHSKYNLGGLPDPEDVEAVGKYTQRLLDLEVRHKTLALQSKLSELEEVKHDLDQLKNTDAATFKQAMDDVLGGSTRDISQVITDIKARLAALGLAPDSDPQIVASEIGKINSERSSIANKLKTEVDTITTAAIKQKDVIEQIMKLLSDLQIKMQTIADAVSANKMQVIPAIKVALQKLEDTIAELIKLAPTSGIYVQQLAALKQQLKQVSQDADPADLVARITKVANDLKSSGDKLAVQNKTIADLVTLLESGSQSSNDVIKSLSDLMTRITNRALDVDIQLANDTAGLLYGTINSIKDAKLQKEAMNLLLSHVSFSFITDKFGIPIQLSYKNIGDSVTNDTQQMAKVVTLIGDHIDTLTKPGNHAYLAAKLNSGVRDPAFIQEVDTLVLTVWVYDMIHTFQKKHNYNMEVAAAKLNDIQSQIQLQDAEQVLKINKAITDAREKYAKGMKDVSTLLFSQIILPGRQTGSRAATYEESVQQIQSKLGELSDNVRQYVPNDTKLPLLPNNRADAGKNNLSLIFNAMTEAYAGTGIFSKPNMQTANVAFTKFLETMKQITSPLTNYNLTSYTSIQNLDQLVKILMSHTLAPSNDLIADLDRVRKTLRSQQTQGSRATINMPQSNLQAVAPIGQFGNRIQLTRSFKATAIDKFIQQTLSAFSL